MRYRATAFACGANPQSTIILRRYPSHALPDIIAVRDHVVIQRAAFTGLQVLVKLLRAGGAENDGIHLGPAQVQALLATSNRRGRRKRSRFFVMSPARVRQYFFKNSATLASLALLLAAQRLIVSST